MKKSVSKVVAKLRGRNDKPDLPSSNAKVKAVASEAPLQGFQPIGQTGETVFDDRPLRFRSLSVSVADLSVLGDPTGRQAGFKIRVAKLSGRKREAGSMVEQRYGGRGYTVPVQQPDPHVSTFIAYDEGILVGTVSVRMDSEKGLSADDLYKAEIDALRVGNQRVCEFTRLAVDRTAASKPVLAGLFHTAFLHAAVIRGITHAVIEVNPRHVAFYRRALDFQPIGPERLNTRVNAPAVLLCVPFANIAAGLKKYAGHPEAPGATRSLFLYGFPADEEAGVLRRLRELGEGS